MNGILPGNCAHPEFHATVDVARLSDVGVYMAEVMIRCKSCGCRFVFVGVDGGLSFTEPRTSPGGVELRVPIRPVSESNAPHN